MPTLDEFLEHYDSASNLDEGLAICSQYSPEALAEYESAISKRLGTESDVSERVRMHAAAQAISVNLLERTGNLRNF